MERTEVTLRIVLQQPPPGVEFGLQKGRGRVYETVQKKRSKGEDLAFNFAVTVKTGKDGSPDLSARSCRDRPASDLSTLTLVPMPARRTLIGVED